MYNKIYYWFKKKNMIMFLERSYLLFAIKKKNGNINYN